MAYRMVYLRIRSSGYHFGWTSDTAQAAFKDESRRLFQELGWELKPGSNGICDTVEKGHQDCGFCGRCGYGRGCMAFVLQIQKIQE